LWSHNLLEHKGKKRAGAWPAPIRTSPSIDYYFLTSDLVSVGLSVLVFF
jgi:hypothetical protein